MTSDVVQEVFGWDVEGPINVVPAEQPRPECTGRACDLSWSIRVRVAITHAGREQEVFTHNDVWRHFSDDNGRDDAALIYLLAVAVRNGVVERVEGGWRLKDDEVSRLRLGVRSDL